MSEKQGTANNVSNGMRWNNQQRTINWGNPNSWNNNNSNSNNNWNNQNSWNTNNSNSSSWSNPSNWSNNQSGWGNSSWYPQRNQQQYWGNHETSPNQSNQWESYQKTSQANDSANKKKTWGAPQEWKQQSNSNENAGFTNSKAPSWKEWSPNSKSQSSPEAAVWSSWGSCNSWSQWQNKNKCNQASWNNWQSNSQQQSNNKPQSENASLSNSNQTYACSCCGETKTVVQFKTINSQCSICNKCFFLAQKHKKEDKNGSTDIKQKKEGEIPKEGSSEDATKFQKAEDMKLCKLCYDADSCMINLTCRHLMMCEKCLNLYRSKHGFQFNPPCPLCKQTGDYIRYVPPIYA